YGGAAGGGKSSALLMAALQYVHIPGYAALLLRRTYTDLTLPDSLMSRARGWLQGTGAKWVEREKTWRFPSGATLSFGYLQREGDRYRYQSAAFQFIGFDELTQFPEISYTYLFSRLRRLKGFNVPVRMRSASNPGNIGHEWVRQRFLIEGKSKGRIFIPARLDDNPYLDRAEYVKSLMELDPITRAQLLDGDWTARQVGGFFPRECFGLLAKAPRRWEAIVRFWDLAASAPKPGKDPDRTCGYLVSVDKKGIFTIHHVVRMRGVPAAVEAVVAQTATMDGREVPIRMEQEPGASGKSLIDAYRRRVLRGYNFRGIPSVGNKVVRAGPVSSEVDAGNVRMLLAPWTSEVLDALEAFPHGAHDDDADALSGAYNWLSTKGQPAIVVEDFYL
ncbi:MAG: phage terminase large subunit, partial [Candidatus Eisenbacteria sp.]|nr:phage terminase large subunit [Candidatus Eisenbacteria bacterium]